MHRLARFATVSVVCFAFTSLPLLSQIPSLPPEQPASQQSAPAADQSVPQQPAAPAQATAPQTSSPADQATPPAPAEATPQPDPTPASRASDHSANSKKKDDNKPIKDAEVHNASLWQDPGDIAAKDMFYGAGGKNGQPMSPFRFTSEDTNGTNPKFNVTDRNGANWRVKLGTESKPEVVASRLLWAVGYYVNDDYLLHVATIRGLRMKRGKNLTHNGDQVINARFERKPGAETKVAIWQWKNNPFRDTREFNGLRVMMAVLNNWDLKDVNNAVYTDKRTGHQIFLVSDIGATFATNTLEMSHTKDKGNVQSYIDSKFITHTTPTTVDFATPGAPTAVLLKSGGVLAKDYLDRKGFEWIGDNIPRDDARWIGSLLGQLSHQQLVDAFRAGDFTPEETNEYITVLESRIAQLKAL
ncbi:MAG TPA: hypothetical protein VHY48_09510 [Acidobacteriaceae bacterium]|jgi:hypothetical protein|nr:hypothetical protein [Acidobacteriaceae bacterium]